MKKFCMIGLALVALAASGCSRLTEANYAKLKAGMGYAEVAQVIGKADQCSETIGLKHCIWGNDERNITADFVADKALVFSSRNIR